MVMQQTSNPGLGFQPRSLADWFVRQQSLSGQLSPYGAYGAMASMINKDITTAGNPMIGADFFTATYGAKVWDALNSQTRFYNVLRKVPWGPTAGYRIRSGRNSSTQPVSEIGPLPTVDKAVLQAVSIVPAFIVSSMGTSSLAQFQGQLEGGIGDALAIEQEATMIDHIKRINQMLMASNNNRVVAGTTAGTNITMINNQWMSVGDVFGLAGTSGATQNIQVTAVNSPIGAGGTVQFNQNVAVSDVLYAFQRGGTSGMGLWSIDDIVQQTGLTVNGVAFSTNEAGGYGSIPVANRSLSTYWAASNVYGNAGVLRYLNTGMVDQAIDGVRTNGGEPDLIFTGIEQLTRLATVLQANQHFIGEGTFQVRQGGEGTLVGYPTGFQISTYKGIPMFHDVDAAAAYQLPTTSSVGGTTDTLGGSALRGHNVYVLDTRFLEIPVLFTTQYMESRDFLQNNFLGVKAIFLTSAQSRCLDFSKQSKVTDLSDGTNLH